MAFNPNPAPAVALAPALLPALAPALAGVLLLLAAPLRAATAHILAAESVYGQVAAQVAGGTAQVASVLNNPGQDPHDFEPGASVARAVAGADIVIENGAGYDPWMDRLLAASPASGRTVISAAELAGAGQGANPHLWYDPRTMPRVAQALAAALKQAKPTRAAEVDRGLADFTTGMAALTARIAALRTRWNGTPVAATEPVFGAMAAALGLRMHGARLQIATMNGTEPHPSDVASFEADLQQHRVRVLITNTQVTSAATSRLREAAGAAGIPIVGISETLPPGTTYTAWMLAELDALESALAR